MSFIRKRNRLPFKKLYQGGSWYFVTICAQDKKEIFATVEENPSFPKKPNTNFPQIFNLNQNGKIIEQEWLANDDFYENIILDEYVIMPNHFHVIVGFDGIPISNITKKPTDLSKIISTFKSVSYKKIKLLYGKNGIQNGKDGKLELSATEELIGKYNTIWQKSFYDHVVRNEKDLDKIREYILDNLTKWHLDSLNPATEIYK